jgi:hypothetical protein
MLAVEWLRSKRVYNSFMDDIRAEEDKKRFQEIYGDGLKQGLFEIVFCGINAFSNDHHI